jgi:hypothetical protein
MIGIMLDSMEITSVNIGDYSVLEMELPIFFRNCLQIYF